MATALSLGVGAAPQWIASVWSLFSSEPLVPWLLKHHIPQLAFSPWYITVPVGVAMFLTVVLIELKVPFFSKAKIIQLQELRKRVEESSRRFNMVVGVNHISDNILTDGYAARYHHAQVWIDSGTVHGCKAYLTHIKGTNKTWQGHEQLTFSPSEGVDTLSKTIYAGVKYDLDVLRVTSGGDIHVST